MIWFWLILGIFVVAVVGLAVVLLRKFPLAATIDLNHLPVVETRKAEIVESRLRRKFLGWWSAVSVRGRPVAGKMGKVMVTAQKKLRDLEHEYKVRSLPVFLGRRERRRINQDIQELLAQAETFLAEGEDKAAEEKCLQAIRLEPRSVPAFKVLGDLYIKTGEYSHAKEVYLFLQKLATESEAVYDHKSDAEPTTEAAVDITQLVFIYQRLAEVYRQLEDLPTAFSQAQEAYRLAPANPKVINDYLEISIALGKKAFAAGALERMREVNPENSKIVEWQEKIENIPDTHLVGQNQPDLDNNAVA
jgi:tetratricopeptide (TPR) repeat protein